MHLRSHILLLLTALAATPPLAATTPAPTATRRVAALQLETLDVSGSSRISKATLESEFGLRAGLTLDDATVMETRSRLIGTGLFRSVILVMRRGTAPGLARLVVELEDDNSVLTDWALGGEFGVTIGERAAAAVDADGPPRGYRLSLLGRNLFTMQHRGALMADIDATGVVREGRAAWGMPRFTDEGVQFDAELLGVDVAKRFLNSQGFGGRAHGMWSRSLDANGEIQYGMAAYVNRKPRFAVPNFPEVVTGPRLAWFKESRLRTFVPSPGWLAAASLLLDPIETKRSTLEMRLAGTLSLFGKTAWTTDVSALGVGIDASSVRGETRFDIPLSNPAESDGDQAAIFVRARGGFDRAGTTELTGSAAIIGLRYHSSGFIAELGLQITRSPDELIREATDAGDELPDQVREPSRRSQTGGAP